MSPRFWPRELLGNRPASRNLSLHFANWCARLGESFSIEHREHYRKQMMPRNTIRVNPRDWYMPAGKASGEPREYQIFTKNVLQTLRRQEKLEPYEGDGIDVPIRLGFATFTFDVALKGSGDRIVIAECKALKKRNRVKQGDIAKFAHEIELLRLHTSSNVAGVFFTKTAYQGGAVKHAQFLADHVLLDISIAVCKPSELPNHIFLTYHKYDPVRDEQIRHHLDHRSIVLSEDMLMLPLSEASARSGLPCRQLRDAISSRKLKARILEGQILIMIADLNEFVGV